MNDEDVWKEKQSSSMKLVGGQDNLEKNSPTMVKELFAFAESVERTEITSYLSGNAETGGEVAFVPPSSSNLELHFFFFLPLISRFAHPSIQALAG